MKRIFLDTNFVIDYFVREGYMGNAEKVLQLGSRLGFRFCISYLTIANFAYILRKEDKETLHSLVERVCDVFEIINNDKSQIEQSLKLSCDDFEDGLQIAAAVDGGCDCIITRNTRDFAASIIPVFTPVEFVEQFE